MNTKLETAIFAAGCFWCYQPLFEMVKGVESVKVGYTGGNKANPTYEEVSSEETGHAEAAIIEFDPTVISYKDLLEVFWHIHNPTTLNRQGNDSGTQYRSAIFYNSDEQKKIAEESLQSHQAEFDNSIVTEITKASEFYEAEDYHQNFYNNNKRYPYCTVVIDPKFSEFKKEFSDLLKA